MRKFRGGSAALRAAATALACAGCVVTKEVPVTVDHYQKQEVPVDLLDCGPEPRPAGFDDRALGDELASVTLWGRGCSEKLGEVRGLVQPAK